MNKQQVAEKLASCGQEHVMKYYDELTEQEKELLLSQAESTDFSVLSSLGSLKGGDRAGSRKEGKSRGGSPCGRHGNQIRLRRPQGDV